MNILEARECILRTQFLRPMQSQFSEAKGFIEGYEKAMDKMQFLVEALEYLLEFRPALFAHEHRGESMTDVCPFCSCKKALSKYREMVGEGG